MPANTLETSAQDAGAAKRLDAFGELVLLAPVSGVIYPLERVPDPVFSQKLAGDGISIDPTDNILRAPCPGEIVQQHAAGHAVTLKTAGDIEVLMHVGIDTVTLKGKGFTPQGKDRRQSGYRRGADRIRSRLRRDQRQEPADGGDHLERRAGHQHCLWNRHSCRRQDPGIDLDLERRSARQRRPKQVRRSLRRQSFCQIPTVCMLGPRLY